MPGVGEEVRGVVPVTSGRSPAAKGAVASLQAQAPGGGAAVHGEISGGVEASDLGDDGHRGAASRTERASDVLGVHDDLAQPGGGVLGGGGGAV